MKKRDFLKVGAAAGLALLAGCSKQTQNTVTNFTLSHMQIWEIMAGAGAGNTVNYFVRDAQYSLPSRDYIAGAFSGALSSFLFNLDTSEWKSEQNDCDDFALAACFLMNFLHHNTVNKVSNTGIAFGEFYYTRKDGVHHAINVAVVRSGNNLKVLFYEPQTYSIVDLTREEIESCTFWRF